MEKPPPIRACKGCHMNPASDKTGLCATCDPNHRWWKKKDDELVIAMKKVTIK